MKIGTAIIGLVFGLIFLLGVTSTIFGTLVGELELIVLGITFVGGAILVLGMLVWIHSHIGTNLTRVQSVTTGSVASITALTTSELAIWIASVNLALVPLLCVLCIPIAQSIGITLHQKFVGERILKNLESASGKTREDDERLLELSRNTSLPNATIYAATGAIALASFLTTTDFAKGTISSISVTAPTVLAIIYYNVSQEQRRIREHIRDSRRGEQSEPGK